MPRARRRFSDGSPLEGPTVRAARAIEPPAAVPDAHRVSIYPTIDSSGVFLLCSCGWTSGYVGAPSPAEAWKLEWEHVCSATVAEAG